MMKQMTVAARAVDERPGELRLVARQRVDVRRPVAQREREAGLERARPERADEHLDRRVHVEDEQPEDARRQQEIGRELQDPLSRAHRRSVYSAACRPARPRQPPRRVENLSLKYVSSASVRPLKILTFERTSSGGKISGLLGHVRVGLRELLLGALDRRHVVHVRRDLGGDRRVVDEVDHQLGRVLVLGTLGDEHVVGPEHAALVGQVPDERLLLGLLDRRCRRTRPSPGRRCPRPCPRRSRCP